jgi:hypothetical protein
MLAIVLSGCGGSADLEDPPPPSFDSIPVVPRTELESTGWGNLVGTVTFEGEIPNRNIPAAMESHADRDHCKKDDPKNDPKDRTWVVDPATRGVANIVVYLLAPKNKFFKQQPSDKKTWKNEEVVDQPYCMFEPHVLVLYPQYFDGKRYAPTGQVLTVKNSAPIAHNFVIEGSSTKNPSKGSSLPAAKDKNVPTLEFKEIKYDKQELSMKCNMHNWMTGFALTFDHPYAAVTDAKGKFEIKNAPSGAEVSVMAWHETLKRFVPGDGKPIKLEDGKTTTFDFKIQK